MNPREEWFSKVRNAVKNNGTFNFYYNGTVYFGYTIILNKAALIVLSNKNYRLSILDVQIGDLKDSIEIDLNTDELHELCIGTTMLESFATRIDVMRQVMTAVLSDQVSHKELNKLVSSVCEAKRLPTEVETLVADHIRELS